MELLKSAMELEESLKSRKLQRNVSSSVVSANASMSDTEKMRMQLFLDLQEMERCVTIFCALSIASYARCSYLVGCVCVAMVCM